MADGVGDTQQDAATIIRIEWSRVVAALVADFGDLSDAEDAAQDAAEQALRQWPEDGFPSRPGGWLFVVARRRLIDRRRRQAVGVTKSAQFARESEGHVPGVDDEFENLYSESLMRDEQLRLIFACCHPALSRDAQVALTLRSVGGLTTQQIATAFLESEPTVAQRLVRAKRKIKAAGIPFKIPPDEELLKRVDLVRSILYLIFNEGYDTSSGSEHLRLSLCDEAIRLAERLAELTSDDPETLGLLALFLLIHSRRDTRLHDGYIVLLDEQDRARWDHDMIARGTDVLDRAIRLRRRGPFQIQAAINALHANSESPESTDWEQIALLYGQLQSLEPTPVVALNYAVAVAMVDGPAVGLARLDDGRLRAQLDSYPYFHAARGRLLADMGNQSEAMAAYELALQHVGNDVERRFLTERLNELLEGP